METTATSIWTLPLVVLTVVLYRYELYRNFCVTVEQIRRHRSLRGILLLVSIALFVCNVTGCRRAAPSPTTVTFLGAWWLQPDELPDAELEAGQFTRETGIAVRRPPVPETLFSSLDPPAQLNLLRKVLHEGGPSSDVLGIDVIWPGILADDLIDLRPYFATELSLQDPELVASYTVHNKVVAMPYHTHIGVLAYRADLLRKYRYSRPPQTWNELEIMAARIQAGERAKGRKDFWGYVWQGAATEGLTCNALEWQISEGGGHIIEDDATISVNNPAVIRAWQRAARWIGSISSPGVVAYRETDSLNAWESGNAAFMRSWQWGYRLNHPRESSMRERTGYTSMSAGPEGRVGALGGYGLAIPRSSAHRQEAVALIRFLISRESRSRADAGHSETADALQLYDLPQILQASAPPSRLSRQSSQLVSRPSNVAGHDYEDVTQAYIKSVHSVLTRNKGAPEAAADLEKQLIQITGLRPGPPK